MLLPSYHPSYLLAHSHTGNRAGDCKADDKVWTKIFSEPELSAARLHTPLVTGGDSGGPKEI